MTCSNNCHDSIQGWFCKMLRNTRHGIKSSIRGEDSIKKAHGKIKSERENGSRDIHPSIPATQARCRFPQFFRGLS